MRFFVLLSFIHQNRFKYFLVVDIFRRQPNYKNKLTLVFLLMKAMELQRLIFILLMTLGVARILDWRGPNHKSHAMTSSEILKEKIFVEQRYRRTNVS